MLADAPAPPPSATSAKSPTCAATTTTAASTPRRSPTLRSLWFPVPRQFPFWPRAEPGRLRAALGSRRGGGPHPQGSESPAAHRPRRERFRDQWRRRRWPPLCLIRTTFNSCAARLTHCLAHSSHSMIRTWPRPGRKRARADLRRCVRAWALDPVTVSKDFRPHSGGPR